MPFREKVRKAFGRSPSDANGMKKTNSKVQIKKPDDEPTPNYRIPLKAEQKGRLQAFSFADTFSRRKSSQSEVSPMGSRMPSRKASMTSRKSMAPSRLSQSNVGQVMEDEEADDDVGNVGLSRQVTADKDHRPHDIDDGSEETKTITASTPARIMTAPAPNGTSGHKPFHEDELTQALEKTATEIPSSRVNGVRYA
ncbi:MAG: hypothetical protein M1827_006062 [Pycnora praestabilis]|nr:MAG: hypothetical protein M1827_006062 [Pycnora praestabilis]